MEIPRDASRGGAAGAARTFGRRPQVIYALPALMLLKGDKVAKASWEKKLAPFGMLGLGIVSAVIGTAATLA